MQVNHSANLFKENELSFLAFNSPISQNITVLLHGFNSFLFFSDLISVKLENNRGLRPLLDMFTFKEDLIKTDNPATDCWEFVQETTHIHTPPLPCLGFATVQIPLFSSLINSVRHFDSNS